MGSTSASLLVFALLALFHTGTCYRCYSCIGQDSDKEIESPPIPGLPITKGCVDPIDTSKISDKPECPGDKNACVKIISDDVYMRTCLPIATCDGYGDKCDACTSDLCNSSSNVVPSVIFVSIVSLAFAKLFL